MNSRKSNAALKPPETGATEPRRASSAIAHADADILPPDRFISIGEATAKVIDRLADTMDDTE